MLVGGFEKRDVVVSLLCLLDDIGDEADDIVAKSDVFKTLTACGLTINW